MERHTIHLRLKRQEEEAEEEEKERGDGGGGRENLIGKCGVARRWSREPGGKLGERRGGGTSERDVVKRVL